MGHLRSKWQRVDLASCSAKAVSGRFRFRIWFQSGSRDRLSLSLYLSYMHYGYIVIYIYIYVQKRVHTNIFKASRYPNPRPEAPKP